MQSFDDWFDSFIAPVEPDTEALVYLLCYEQPLTRRWNDGRTVEVRHYAGYVHASRLFDRRMKEHTSHDPKRAGALPAAMARNGSAFEVVRTWTVPAGHGRAAERRIKQVHGGIRTLCPNHAA